MMMASRWLLVFAAVLLLAPMTVHAQPQITAVTSTPSTPVQAGQTLVFSASASIAGGGALEYRWDFGDGTPRTPWLPVPEATHAYAGAGTYTVLVQVRHASQGLAAATSTLVVRLPQTASARQSGGIVVHPDRREVWNVNTDHGTVSVLDPDTLTRIDEVAVGRAPVALAIDASGDIWVSLRDDDRLRKIDIASRTVTATIDLGYGARPAGIVIAPGGTAGYVALSGRGAVRRFDAMTALPGALLDGVAHAQSLALDSTGTTLFVSRLISAGGSGTIWRVALPAFASAEPIALPLDATSPDSGTAARGLPNTVGALALADDGRDLWYGGKKDNILRGLHREGQPLTFESVLRSLLGRVDAIEAVERVPSRMDLDDSGRVSALLFAPGSSHLFAALETNNRVVVVDPWNRREIIDLPVGLAPRGLAFDAITGRLFVQDFLSRTVSVYAIAALLDDGVSIPQALGAIPTTQFEALGEQIMLGKRVFYDAEDPRMAQDGYTACAACHLDGGHDGRVWDFTQLGEGLRNTTGLRGSAGLSRGLVHWSGNFDEIQDFEVPIRNLFGGIGFMDDADYFTDGRNLPLGPPKAGFSVELDALAAYVASLDEDDRSPDRQADGALTPEASAGRIVFAELQCQRCHAGDAFTDSAHGLRHDVGTLTAASGNRLGAPLRALDTPTLRGLFTSEPYLHDGSAAGLIDVLVTRNPDGAHGDIGALDASERGQLVAFLRQIDASEPAVGAAAQLTVTSPVAGAGFEQDDVVDFAIATDLAQITRVDYLADGVAVASSTAAPWSAQWAAVGNGDFTVEALVTHAQGRYRTLSPPVRISVTSDRVFTDGFESTP